MIENSIIRQRRENASYFYDLKQKVVTANFAGLSVLADDRLSGSIAACAFFGATELTTVSLSNITGVGRYAFQSCTNLSNVYLPKLQFFDDPFGGTAVTVMDFPELTSFSLLSPPKTLISFNAPHAVGVLGPTGLGDLEFFNAPYTESINSAFYNCTKIKSVYLPFVSSLGTYYSSNIFYNCQQLSIINMPSLSSIIMYPTYSAYYSWSVNAFYNCSNLKIIRFPNLSASFMNSSFFSRIYSTIEEIQLGSISTISSYTFYNMYSLKTLRITSVNSIYSAAFMYCNNLMSLYIFNSSSTPYISSYYSAGLGYTPFATSKDGKYASLYVPINMVSSYLASYSWTYCIPNLSSRIVGLTDGDIMNLKREWGEII